MFKKIATSLALTVGLSLPSIASELTQINSQLVCGDYPSVNATLSEYEEVPFVKMVAHRLVPSGDVIQNQMVIFVNPQTKSYTIVERFSEDLFCVVSIGQQVRAAEPK